MVPVTEPLLPSHTPQEGTARCVWLFCYTTTSSIRHGAILTHISAAHVCLKVRLTLYAFLELWIIPKFEHDQQEIFHWKKEKTEKKKSARNFEISKVCHNGNKNTDKVMKEKNHDS